MARDALEVLRQEFLLTRGKLLEVAATLDRIERATSSTDRETVQADPQMQLLLEAIQILAGPEGDRAEAIQRLMSRPYDPSWRSTYSI